MSEETEAQRSLRNKLQNELQCTLVFLSERETGEIWYREKRRGYRWAIQPVELIPFTHVAIQEAASMNSERVKFIGKKEVE